MIRTIRKIATGLWRLAFSSGESGVPVDTSPLKSLSLWGDGDEIYAIEDVEIAFNTKHDCSGAKNWLTVGDIYDALLRSLGANGADTPETWVRFAAAIAQETDVDPSWIVRQTF